MPPKNCKWLSNIISTQQSKHQVNQWVSKLLILRRLLPRVVLAQIWRPIFRIDSFVSWCPKSTTSSKPWTKLLLMRWITQTSRIWPEETLQMLRVSINSRWSQNHFPWQQRKEVLSQDTTSPDYCFWRQSLLSANEGVCHYWGSSQWDGTGHKEPPAQWYRKKFTAGSSVICHQKVGLNCRATEARTSLSLGRWMSMCSTKIRNLCCCWSLHRVQDPHLWVAIGCPLYQYQTGIERSSFETQGALWRWCRFTRITLKTNVEPRRTRV